MEDFSEMKSLSDEWNAAWKDSGYLYEILDESGIQNCDVFIRQKLHERGLDELGVAHYMRTVYLVFDEEELAKPCYCGP